MREESVPRAVAEAGELFAFTKSDGVFKRAIEPAVPASVEVEGWPFVGSFRHSGP